MASFQSKIGRKRPRKTENKNYHSVSFIPGAKYKIKKNSKKIQKIKKHIMDSYQAKKNQKMIRKSENKNYRSVPFLPDEKQKFPKEQQKNSGIKKYHYGFISIQNRLEEAEKNRK